MKHLFLPTYFPFKSNRQTGRVPGAIPRALLEDRPPHLPECPVIHWCHARFARCIWNCVCDILHEIYPHGRHRSRSSSTIRVGRITIPFCFPVSFTRTNMNRVIGTAIHGARSLLTPTSCIHSRTMLLSHSNSLELRPISTWVTLWLTSLSSLPHPGPVLLLHQIL